jgi:hypothetical protein
MLPIPNVYLVSRFLPFRPLPFSASNFHFRFHLSSFPFLPFSSFAPHPGLFQFISFLFTVWFVQIPFGILFLFLPLFSQNESDNPDDSNFGWQKMAKSSPLQQASGSRKTSAQGQTEIACAHCRLNDHQHPPHSRAFLS